MIKIGIMVVAQPANAASSLTRIRIKKSATQTGSFSTITTQKIATDGLAYYDTGGSNTDWYKISYLLASGSVLEDETDAFQPQDEKYTTVRRVESFLRLSTITNLSNPNIQQVTDLIKRAQDLIDYRTGHAWRLRYCGTRSGDEQSPRFEYYDIDFQYEYQTGRPIYLGHRFIRTFDSTAGDALGIYDGSTYEDFLATKTEDRDGDFWVEYDRGILYIKARWGVRKPLGLRIKYRYGESVVNRTVEDVCTKLVAIDLLTGESRGVFVPEGQFAAMSYNSKIARWREDIENSMTSLKEWKVLGMAT